MLQTLLCDAAGVSSLPDWDRVARVLTPMSLPAGRCVFMQDEEHPYVYGVQRGLVKLHYLAEDGREWIKSFAQEGRFFASQAALMQGGRTSFMATTLERTDMERVDYHLLEELASRHLEWARALLRLTGVFAARKEQREWALLTLTAEERYQAFIREEASLAARVPQKELARYLGVTPVGLSRIVVRLRK